MGREQERQGERQRGHRDDPPARHAGRAGGEQKREQKRRQRQGADMRAEEGDGQQHADCHEGKRKKGLLAAGEGRAKARHQQGDEHGDKASIGADGQRLAGQKERHRAAERAQIRAADVCQRRNGGEQKRIGEHAKARNAVQQAKDKRGAGSGGGAQRQRRGNSQRQQEGIGAADSGQQRDQALQKPALRRGKQRSFHGG